MLGFRKYISEKNNRILIGNIGATFAIKGLAMVVGLLAVPAYIAYFRNNDILGLWYTIIAALNWILTFDFGIGNGLRNNLARSLSKQETERARQLVSTAYFIIGVISALFLAVGELAIFSIDPTQIFNLNGDFVSIWTLRVSLSIVYCGTIIHFWLKLITSVLYAMQKTALNNSLLLAGNVILLLWLLFSVEAPVEDKLLSLSVVQSLSINVPLFACTLFLFFGRYKSISPSFRYFERSVVKEVVGLGGLFFVIQLSLLVVNSTNEYLIAFFYDAPDVVTYQVYWKIFFLVVTVFSLVVQPMWSGMTVAYSEKRYSWIIGVYKKLNIFSVIGAFVAAGIALLFPFIVDVWIGDKSIGVLAFVNALFAVWVMVNLFVNSATCVSNATSRLRVQVLFSVIAAVAKIPLVYVFYMAGFPWYSVVLSNVLVLLPLLIAQVIDNHIQFKSWRQ